MDELAETLGVTHRHVRRLVAERRVPFLRVGRFIRFDPAQITDWLNANRVPGEEPHGGPPSRPARRW
jgi:excisionase family DNA binding protein